MKKQPTKIDVCNENVYTFCKLLQNLGVKYSYSPSRIYNTSRFYINQIDFNLLTISKPECMHFIKQTRKHLIWELELDAIAGWADWMKQLYKVVI